LLEDTSFDREGVPKDQAGDLLVSLFKKKAFDEQSSVLFSQYPIKEKQLDRLIREDIIHLFSQNSIKIYLTNLGRIVACEEFALRQREKKIFTIENFENQVAEMIDNVEKIARDYELARKKKIFEIKCPYPKIIKIYENIRQMLIDHGWNEQAVIYNKQIKFYQEKLEKDKKLREIVVQKVQKQKEIEELHKIKEINTIRAVIFSLNREERILDFEEKKKEKLKESEEIFNMISNAERMAKEYEKEIKRGRILHLDCPYEEIREIYNEVKKKFERIGWKEESSKMNDSIRYYKDKLEKDKRLREIEERK